MQDTLGNKETIPREKNNLKIKALDFITHGVGCNCLVALHKAGILRILLENDFLTNTDLEAFQNLIAVKSAIVTLEKSKIIKLEAQRYRLTDFGRTLCEYIGLITIFFDGYAPLVANQAQIVTNKAVDNVNLVRWPSVANASISISENNLDQILITEFMNLRKSGTICDLGCGQGVMLSKICEATNNPGLGFEASAKTVDEAKSRLKNFLNISVEVGDISRLEGIWEDVVYLLQAFVFHDFTPNEKCINILNAYLTNFPNVRYFFYVDIVSPSPSNKGLFPGFDYIHGLLGIPTRTYEETIELFNSSNYTIQKEIGIQDLPNTYLWILSPVRRNENE